MAVSSVTAASTSAAVNFNNKSYAVFINHRGVDVKKTFARYLYLRLLHNRLTAFLDAEEMQPGYSIGSQIAHAVSTATVHVAIFSPRYAESSWCLGELVLMLQSNAPIIPVFFRVTPAQVKWTLDGYGRALQTHEDKRRHDPNTIGKWRETLEKVADNSGFELETGSGTSEELELALADKVVQHLSEMIGLDERRKDFEMIGFDEKVGLDKMVEDFERNFLVKHRQSAKPQVVRIVGVGGVGKTTLAKELFRRKRSDYNKSCFLSDVREYARRGLLTSLQSQLLKSLNPSVEIDTMDERRGRKELRKHISDSSVLIILDDVGDLNQIDALLPVRIDDLLSNSLIVITSRDEGVITRSGVGNSSTYKLNGLNQQHSRELFCAHCFSQPRPRRGFECLVDKLLKACAGLPLCLKVIGALLYGDFKRPHWENICNKLIFPTTDKIEESIKISYESLTMEQKYIFLDIACFFIGLKRNTAIVIWNGSGWNGLLGFQNLHNKCLVEVDNENNIHMHDRLRDFGRAQAATLSPSRLLNCINILEQLSVQPVRGIRMVLGEYNDDAFDGNTMPSLQLLDTEGVPSLQLLDTEGDLMERILKNLMSPSLLWLRWNRCPNSSLPSWIRMESLRVLQVSGSELSTLWEDEQAPLQLRELEIRAPLSDIPWSIWRLEHLEHIVIGKFLSGQVNLTKLREEFCYLRSLKTLVLTECSIMESLPDSFGHLRTLRHIDLSFCCNLERMPDSIGFLSRVEHINLSYCRDLKSLPDSIGLLSGLQHIDLQGCRKLETLPNSFAHLTDLRHINLSGWHHLERLPDCFGNFRLLEHIDLKECHILKELPQSFGDLNDVQHINLSNCRDLERLPDSFANLRNLKYMDLSGCHNLERLPRYLENLIQLKYLDVKGCSNLSIGTLDDMPPHLEVAHRSQLEQLLEIESDLEH